MTEALHCAAPGLTLQAAFGLYVVVEQTSMTSAEHSSKIKDSTESNFGGYRHFKIIFCNVCESDVIDFFENLVNREVLAYFTELLVCIIHLD